MPGYWGPKPTILALEAPILTPEASILVTEPPILAPESPILAPKAPILAPDAPILVKEPQILAPETLFTSLALFVLKLRKKQSKINCLLTIMVATIFDRA